MTLVCVPIMVEDEEDALADARRAKDAGADLVELRLDHVFSGSGDEDELALALRLVEHAALPCIATCRCAREGGHYDGDEDRRIALFERLGTAPRPPRYIDVELEAYTRSANPPPPIRVGAWGSSLILSMHDPAGRPADLSRRLLRMRAEPAARVLKVAYRARSLRDNLELLDLPADSDRPTIALGMGRFGLLSRVLAPKFGGFLTFASLRPESATAPGQPTVRELLDLYRFRSIGPATSVYGVVGWPVEHSLSPHVHNAGFEAVGHDGVYLPMPVQAGEEGAGGYESLKATLGELAAHPRLGLRGCSVTIPHKQSLVRLARELGWGIEPGADAIGAANTLALDRDEAGGLLCARVLNTDAGALVGVVAEAIGPPGGRSIAILGAGGAARAAAYGLASAGAEVVVFNRSEDGARRLADELGARGLGIGTAPLGRLGHGAFDAVVNCTPVGMRGGPAPGDTPAGETGLDGLSPGGVVIESVYNPLRTPLLARAAERGVRTVDGLAMFVRQAAAQFELWTGQRAPVGLFDRVAREKAEEKRNAE